MFKYITAPIVVGFLGAVTIYCIVLLLVYFDPDLPRDNFFGRILNSLLYVGPLLIVSATVRDILKERARQKNGRSDQ